MWEARTRLSNDFSRIGSCPPRSTKRSRRQFCKANVRSGRLFRSSLLTIVLEPTDNLVIGRAAPTAQRFVVMEVCHTVHHHCLADKRAKYVPSRSAAVDRYIGIGRIDRSGQLCISA